MRKKAAQLKIDVVSQEPDNLKLMELEESVIPINVYTPNRQHGKGSRAWKRNCKLRGWFDPKRQTLCIHAVAGEMLMLASTLLEMAKHPQAKTLWTATREALAKRDGLRERANARRRKSKR